MVNGKGKGSPGRYEAECHCVKRGTNLLGLLSYKGSTLFSEVSLDYLT
jgi:hypothetical protein